MSAIRNFVLAGTVALAGLAATHGTGHAEYIKRTMLLQSCSGRDPARLNDCTGYIIGIADAASEPPAGGGKPEICVSKITVKTMRESVVSYLQAHPGADGPAAPAVLEALRTLYKC